MAQRYITANMGI